MVKVKISIEFDEDHNEDAPRPDCRDSRDAPTLWKRLWKWLEPTLRVLLLLQIMVAVLPLLGGGA